MAEREGKRDVSLTISFLMAMFIIALILVFVDRTQGLDQSYITTFAGIYVVGIIGILLFTVVTLLMGGADHESYRPALFDSSKARGLASIPYTRLIAGIFLAIVFALAASSTEQSIVPVINPFNSDQLITTSAQFSTIPGTTLNSLRSGIYPSFGEEILGWAFTTVGTLTLLGLASKKFENAFSSPLFVIPAALISSLAWGIVFATGHLLVYGISAKAYGSAFAFGFINQFINQLVGAPVSVLAHFFHNFTLVFSVGVALGIGANAFIIPFFRKGGISMNRHGMSSLLIIGIIAIIALILGAGYFVAKGESPLSVASPACSDFVDVPGGVTCSIDTDCTDKLVPAGKALDDGTELRCNSGSCQIRLQTCNGVTA